ncbi:MAG: hypothetical protein K1X54_13405 [Flavobacteriales bacterium]|nr:hypothetical protein [Flavobacteriales bacterium]
MILFLLLCTTQWSAIHQIHDKQFEVIHNNKNIGSIYLQSNEFRDTIEYKLYSNVFAEGFVNMRIEESIHNVFVRGYLEKASHHRHIHHLSDKYSNLWHEHDGYYTSEGKWSAQPTLIAHSVLQFYFKEPTQVNEVFSEQLQEMVPLRKLSDRKYQLSLPNGHSTIFHYDDSGLILVESNTTWGAVQFKVKS